MVAEEGWERMLGIGRTRVIALTLELLATEVKDRVEAMRPLFPLLAKARQEDIEVFGTSDKAMGQITCTNSDTLTDIPLIVAMTKLECTFRRCASALSAWRTQKLNSPPA